MTNDCSFVEPHPRKGRTFAVSLGASFAALAVVVAAILAAGAPTADATVYTMSGGSSAFNWTDTTRWSPSGVPGTGDTAVVNLGTTITIDTNVNGVILSMVSFGTNINIPSGSTLKLEPSSSLNSTNNINVNGGTLAFDTGTTSNGSAITLNTGTLNLIGNLSVLAGSGSFTWNGGQITGSGTLTNPSSGGINITGTGGGMTITGATIDNFGSINYSSASAQSLSINSGAHIKVESGGSFLLTGSDPIQSDLTATPSIDILSGASMSKGGITSSTVGVPVNNAGNVSAGTGTLYLAEGGTHTGVFSLAGTGGVFKFNSSVTAHTFSPGATESGTLGLAQIIGGNFNVNTTSGSPIIFPKLDQLGGTVGSTGYLKVSGTFNWTGGTQSGAGTTEIASGAVANLNGSSATTLDTSRLFLNNGTINYAPTSSVLSINNGAKISNNGIIDLQNDSSINSTTPASSSIDNAGAATLKKSAGVSTAIACLVNLAGTSSIAPGASTTIALGAGGSWGGAPVSIDLSAAGSVVKLAGGTFTLNASVTAPGSGRIAVLGNMALNTALGITNFELDNGGTVTTVAAGLLTINGTLYWNGGTFTGLGTITLANTAAGNLTALTGPPVLANGITFSNNGSISYNPTQSLTFTNSGGGGATFNNSATGTFDIQGSGTTTFSGAGHSFNVLGGTVKKSVGASFFLFTIPYNQSGGLTDVPLASAIIGITGGGSFIGGTMQAAAAGSEIAFNSTPAYSVNGGTFSGTVALKGGTLTAAGPVTAPVTFNQIAGTLNGASTLTIPSASTYTMTGGFLTPSLVTISSGGQLMLDSTTSSLTLGTITNNAGGNILWSAGSNLITNSGASGINNIGTMELRGSGTFGSAVGGTLNSTGTLKKTVGAGTVTMAMPVAITNGTLSVQAGTLSLANTATVTHGGTFDVQAGTTLIFNNGNHTLGAGSVFTAGTGNVVINSPAIVSLGTSLAIPTLTLNGGQLTGGSGLSTTNSFSWTGGTMDGAGTTTITSGTFSLTTGPMTLGRNLTIPGNTTVTLGSSALNVVSAVNIINGGTFDIHSGTLACAACGASFVNNGILQASAPGNATVAVPVTGTGGLVVNGAIFNGQAGEAFNTATIDNGAATFTGNPINIGSVSNGGTFPGVINVQGGATGIAGAVNFGSANSSIAVYAGTLTLNGTTSVVTFALNGGTVNGSGNVTASTSFVFNTGALGGSGLFTSNGTGALSGSGGAMSLSRSLTNGGTMTYAPTLPANILTAGANVIITNNGTFDFTNENFAASGAPLAQFVNSASGTFRRIAGNTGTLNFDPAVSNAGTTLFGLGTTNFTNGFAQSAGTTTLSGGNVSTPGNMAINGGALNAYGTISGFLKNNGGTVNVQNGVSPATLIINGSYLQTALGLLNVKLNGPATPGTTYSQLNVSNTVSLGGTFSGTVGYAPVNGDVFLPLTYGSNPGGTDFSAKNFAPLGPGVTFNPAYIVGPPQALQITVATSSADLSLTQAAQPSAFVGQNVPITLTVTNNGPATATATITDTFTGGAFISATPSAGGICSGSGPVTCTFAGMANAATGTVTLVLGANAAGTITNNASVSSGSTFDPSSANNTPAPANILVTTAADLSLTKTSNNPGPGGNVIYTVTVTNNGPSTATGVTIADTTPAGLTFVSATGACPSFPCAIASLTNGSSATVIATYSLNNPGAQVLFNTANVSASTADPNTANNSATASTNIGCPTAPVTTLPGNNTTGLPFNGTLFWNGNSGQFKIYLGPVGSGCQTLLGTSSTNSIAYANLQPATQYEWRVEGIATACPTLSSACATFTTAPSCAQPPAPTAPASGATLSSPIVFTWSGVPGATDYHLFASVNGGSSLDLGTTAGTSLTLSIGDGTVVWYVVANVPGCGQLQSPSSSFHACNDLPTPIASVVADAASGQSYNVTWDAIPGATSYEVSEASNANFTGATIKTLTTASASFQHTVTVGTALFYRVRAFGGCKQQFSGYSNTARVVLLPVVSSSPGQNPSANVPVGSTLKVVQTVFIPGFPDGTFQFAATVDKPWLTVQPSSGALPPSGVTLQVLGDPTDLPNGTFTGTVIVTIGSFSGAKATSNATTTVSVPISINLVTPVKPGTSATPPANALIIPSVGHLDGLNSKWQSDVRLANPTATKQSYALTFTPDDPTLGVKTTTITVASNDTTALDDIVRNWYGVGSLGESANGVLLIVPSSGSGGTSIGVPVPNDNVPNGTVPNVSVQTVAVASSRTYNVTSTGTLGQFIPAIPFGSFIDKNAAALSLQQIAQNDAFRTNLGLVEGSGSPATVLLSVFSSAGGKLLEQSVDLKGNEQKQLNSFLAANAVTLADGRIEIKVTSGTGKITAYASVVDNKTGDPLLVSGVPITAAANHFVLPGVAALNNGIANWRSDVRIYNGGTSAQAATLTLYPLNSTSAPLANSIVLNPGEVRGLDDIVKSYFSLDNTGGSLHVTTSGDSPLVVSGRTYNLTTNGTYGQFISAVTPADGVGKNDRALNVLQVEDSVRYRTNLGLAELTGNPATVEVSVFLPDSKVIPKVQFSLGPNEYRQTAILHDLGLSNIYNARISVRVLDGAGKVTAYGSVIDMQTQDPTYVPAQ